MNTLIVTDKSALNKLVTQTIVQMKKTDELLHKSALSVMLHALTHGDCSHMNRLFAAMHQNTQTAFRTYWKRLSWEIIGDPDVSLVKFSKDDGFSMLRTETNPDAMKYRKAAGDFVVNRLASDQPGKWKPDATGNPETAKPIVPFYATDNIRDALTDYDGRAVYKAVKKLYETATGEKAPGGGKVNVSRHVVAEIEKALRAIDRLVNNDSAVEERKEEKTTVKPKANKPKARNAKPTVEQPAAGI